MWKKGLSGNPLGGGKGPKARKWETLEFWMAQLTAEMNRVEYVTKTNKDGSKEQFTRLAVTADTRAKIMADLFKVLLARKAKAAKSPSESVSNANDALKALKELSDYGSSKKDNGNTSSVDARRSDVQAIVNPKVDEAGLGSEPKPQ